MSVLTTAQEYQVVREAIQSLSPNAAGAQRAIVSFSIGDMQVTYQAGQLQWLQERERELAKRLTQRNSRKRVTPDFAGAATSDYLTL